MINGRGLFHVDGRKPYLLWELKRTGGYYGIDRWSQFVVSNQTATIIGSHMRSSERCHFQRPWLIQDCRKPPNFLNFPTPFRSLEGVKVQSQNLARRLTIASSSPRITNLSLRVPGHRHVTLFSFGIPVIHAVLSSYIRKCLFTCHLLKVIGTQ